MRSYCFVRFPRAGLGNRLIPWARAEVFADLHQVDFVRPQWVQFKVGPLLRGEPDLRLYAGQFCQRSGTLPTWKRFWPVVQQVDNPRFDMEPIVRDVAYLFDDYSLFFSDLVGHNDLIVNRLRQVTRSKVLARAEDLVGASLAVHIRLGDFRSIPGAASSIEWYAQTVHELLEAFPQLSPALVFSDASDVEIASVLSHPLVKRVTTGTALGDLWALSRARVLVASGNSSFSAWASYLSQMPTLYEPGRDLRQFFKHDPAVNWLWEANSGHESDYLNKVAHFLDG